MINQYYPTVNIIYDVMTRVAKRSDQDKKRPHLWLVVDVVVRLWLWPGSNEKPHLWLVVVVVDHRVHKLTPVLTTKPADHY